MVYVENQWYLIMTLRTFKKMLNRLFTESAEVPLRKRLALAGESFSLSTPPTEIEHEFEFHLQVDENFGKYLASKLIKNTTYPFSEADDKIFFQFDDSNTPVRIKHLVQTQINDSGKKFRIRREISDQRDSLPKYILALKTKTESGFTKEKEVFFGICTYEKEENYEYFGVAGMFDILFNSNDEYQAKTRLSFDGKTKNNENYKMDIDIHFLEGFTPNDYNVKWSNIIKVDIEHSGSMLAEEAFSLIKFPYVRRITDQNEIQSLYKNVYTRYHSKKNEFNVAQVLPVVI